MQNKDNRRNTLQKPTRQNKPRRQLDAHEYMLLTAKREQKEMRFDLNKSSIYGQVVNFDKFSVIVLDKRTKREVAIFKSA
ncbi:hypothetical protein JCM19235_1221 [Vibrio maritimus]|uniref:Uncharacterized protein n=1 Tax=Vibrio maritimus TaxID=990268 RepID=A0A090S5D0_9VIBR|nr:hypothetical protein JCM19235_1221 [Vibrio maritimus]